MCILEGAATLVFVSLYMSWDQTWIVVPQLPMLQRIGKVQSGFPPSISPTDALYHSC